MTTIFCSCFGITRVRIVTESIFTFYFYLCSGCTWVFLLPITLSYIGLIYQIISRGVKLKKSCPPFSILTSLPSPENEETYSGMTEVVVQDIVTILSCNTWVFASDEVFVVVVCTVLRVVASDHPKSGSRDG